MRFDPFRVKSTPVDVFPPESFLWVPVLDNKDLGSLICDAAFTSESEARRHWWFTQMPEDARVDRMPVKEYLRRCPKGMNPFFELGKADFIKEYNEYWRT